MTEEVTQVSTILSHWKWVIPVVVIFLLSLLLHLALSAFDKRVSPRLAKTLMKWDSAFLKALILPIKVCLWVLATTFAIQIFSFHIEHARLVELFQPLRDTLLIFTLLWFAIRFINNMQDAYLNDVKRKSCRFDQTTIRAICQISRIVVIVLAGLIFLQSRDVNLSGVLAFGGAGGLIVGLAAKDLLSNFFGALMIYLDRPFSIGDWISSPDREIEGYVESIGWRLTRIRSLERRPIYVPSGIFSSITVVNVSRMSNRRIKTQVGIRYEDAQKLEGILKEVEAMIQSHPDIDTHKPLMVRFNAFGASSLNFLIYCFTKTTESSQYLSIQQEIFLKTIQIIETHGAACALPATTLHIPDGIALKQ